MKAAVDKQTWDDSIKSLVATPEVLQMMSSKLDWTQKLGDAVVAQQPDVMDAIQRLRTKAQANNKLQSTKEQKVTVQQVQNRQVIAIEPTDPDMVYVPYYDPSVVYGDWPYPDYPPYYLPAPGYFGAGIIAAGLGFGAGYALGRWARRQLLGRRGQLEQQQHQCPARRQRRRHGLAAPRRPSPRRRQSRQSRATAEFPRQRRRAGDQAGRRWQPRQRRPKSSGHPSQCRRR